MCGDSKAEFVGITKRPFESYPSLLHALAKTAISSTVWVVSRFHRQWFRIGYTWTCSIAEGLLVKGHIPCCLCEMSQWTTSYSIASAYYYRRARIQSKMQASVSNFVFCIFAFWSLCWENTEIQSKIWIRCGLARSQGNGSGGLKARGQRGRCCGAKAMIAMWLAYR